MTSDVLTVALGGALGALTRLSLIRLSESARRLGSGPWDGAARATLVANGVGCLLFGLWSGSVSPESPLDVETATAPILDAFVLAGLCGGLTTFSSAVADGHRLRAAHGARSSLGYVAATCTLGLACLLLGLRLAP